MSPRGHLFFSDGFPSVSLLIRIEVCTLREHLYSINGLVFSDMCVVLLVSNLVTYPYPSCSGTTESFPFSTYKLISYYTNSTKSEKMPCSVNPTLPNILTSVLSFLVRLCVVYFVTPLNNPHILSPLL